jgi:hypothetical protein
VQQSFAAPCACDLAQAVPHLCRAALV